MDVCRASQDPPELSVILAVPRVQTCRGNKEEFLVCVTLNPRAAHCTYQGGGGSPSKQYSLPAEMLKVSPALLPSPQSSWVHTTSILHEAIA